MAALPSGYCLDLPVCSSCFFSILWVGVESLINPQLFQYALVTLTKFNALDIFPFS
jgi:hypothetical protein